jgi:hypothetical protein
MLDIDYNNGDVNVLIRAQSPESPKNFKYILLNRNAKVLKDPVSISMLLKEDWIELEQHPQKFLTDSRPRLAVYSGHS